MRERKLIQTLSAVDADSKVTATNKTNKLLPRVDLFEMDLAGRWIRQSPRIHTPTKDVGAHG